MLNVNRYANIRAVRIIGNGQTLFEYIRENEKETTVFPVGCIFKSFLAVLVGIAIHEKRIGSIEDCILDYVDHEEITNDHWYQLKIKHALSKTTGIRWPGPQEPMPVNMREVMALPFESEPGVSFQYKPDPQIIVYLLEEIYGMTITELFRTKFVSHLTNQAYEWERDDIQGMRVSMGLLDELGQLVLNQGIINGKRLFSEEYHQQMMTAYSRGGAPEWLPYGLGWWMENNASIPCFSACGFGGQRLVVVPQRQMVISILSDMDRPHPENRELVEMALQPSMPRREKEDEAFCGGGQNDD